MHKEIQCSFKCTLLDKQSNVPVIYEKGYMYSPCVHQRLIVSTILHNIKVTDIREARLLVIPQFQWNNPKY